LFSPIRQKKSEIDNESQDVLGEIDSPCCCPGIFLQKSSKRARSGEIEALAPTIQHGDYEGRSDEEQGDVRKAGHIASDNIIRGFIDGYSKQGHETQERKRPAELISGHCSWHGIHDTASEKRKRSSIMEVRFHTLYANTSPFQKPARVFYLLNARNPAVVALLLFNLLKSGSFEQGNK